MRWWFYTVLFWIVSISLYSGALAEDQKRQANQNVAVIQTRIFPCGELHPICSKCHSDAKVAHLEDEHHATKINKKCEIIPVGCSLDGCTGDLYANGLPDWMCLRCGCSPIKEDKAQRQDRVARSKQLLADHRYLCKDCVGPHTCDMSQCVECGNPVTSGGHKLCHVCVYILNECADCRKKFK